MAIAFARIEFLKRSDNKNACCKAAYNSRGKIKFNGHDFSPSKTYNWSYKEKCVHSEILLPNHVDPSFKSPEILWNAAEAVETKKNSQVAKEVLLALPDDACLSIEDRIELGRRFIIETYVSKGLAAQIDIHPPEIKTYICPETGKKISVYTNWHLHALMTTRRFTEDGKKLGEKARDLMPTVKTMKNSDQKLFVEGERIGKIFGIFQNEFFEEKGIPLRVDPTGIIPQIHLGPVRMRGRAYGLIEENNLRTELNQEQAQNPLELLNSITKYKNIFSKEDLEALLEKFVEEKHHSKIITEFWEQKGIVSLLDKEGNSIGKFTTREILAEEKRCLDFASSIQKKEGLRLENTFGQFSSGLSDEQKDAYKNIINGKRLSCIGGYAGTGKSHLLVALKKTYEFEGYTVRAFGPDTATSKVLEEKGFKSENVYSFLFYLNNEKRKIAHGKEVWIVDEASKLGNAPMTQLLKAAKENNAQLIFSGDQFQMGEVERGSMYKTFCEKYGSEDLSEIKRQKRELDKKISKQIATGKISEAIDEITRTGGIIWDETRKECIEQLITKWAVDKEAFPNKSSLIIANSQGTQGSQ